MKTICFYFQIHQPFRLKRYRFFDIGVDHYYYDDYNNENIIRRIVERCYLPANRIMLEMIKNANGRFKVSFSITGTALEQLEIYAPEVIDGFRELAKTGHVEFLAETYAHSLSSLADNPEEFIQQVKMHSQKIESLFNVKPTAFRNTELIYSDEIAALVASMGYHTMLTEGAKHILGWKSPNYVYHAAGNKKMKLLLKNSKLSDDIAFRFSNYEWDQFPLTADKYMSWIASYPEEEQLINLFMNYETLGELQRWETGIFEFFKALPHFAEQYNIQFSTPSEVAKKMKAVDGLSVPYPISWTNEERDISAWLGNIMQKEAFEKLYEIGERVSLMDDRSLKHDWLLLQSCDHFYYMSTKHFSDGAVQAHYSPYESPYEAFNTYMNVISDLEIRINEKIPESIDNEELNSLMTTIHNQDSKIEVLEKELKTLKSKKKKPVTSTN
ncbi:MAG: glycoside hydrolase family 57 protein [Candidatus Azobacteroides sp.]|nr:glycoside hydrolase family 57 protein [Candidatus Azobacteroides sp.]